VFLKVYKLIKVQVFFVGCTLIHMKKKIETIFSSVGYLAFRKSWAALWLA